MLGAAAAAAPHPVAVLYVLCGLVSFLYHCACESRYVNLDTLISTAVVFANVYLAVQMYDEQPLWTSAAMASGFLGLILYAVSYDTGKHSAHYARYHTLWHLNGAASCILLWAPRWLSGGG